MLGARRGVASDQDRVQAEMNLKAQESGRPGSSNDSG